MGLSCLIVAHRGSTRHAVLFDTGPEEYAFERNTTRLDADLGLVESIVLSHGHWDHAGAMLLALLQNSRPQRWPCRFRSTRIPACFAPARSSCRTARMRRMEDIPSVDDLTAFGAEVIATREPQTFLDDMFFVSGEIPRVTGYERGYPGQVRLADDGRSWEPDELLIDERFLAVNVAGKGLVVFSACSHAGIVNVLTHARNSFPSVPLHAAMGGLHLVGTERGDHFADGRGHARLRPEDHRGRPLHGLARHDGACQRLRRPRPGADCGRQAIYVLRASGRLHPRGRFLGISPYRSRLRRRVPPLTLASAGPEAPRPRDVPRGECPCSA